MAGEGKKLALNEQAAQALRDLADALPVAVTSIVTSTETLTNVYQSVSEDIGVHSDDFATMINLIKTAQNTSAEAINALPPLMRKTADEISIYVATHRTVSGNSQA